MIKKMKHNRLRSLLCLGAACALLLSSLAGLGASAANADGLQSVTLDPNALYNGIVVPDNWNYALSPHGDVIDIPYLKSQVDGGYAPAVVNIDTGRQLFVDDFLIESTNLSRYYYQATLLEEPVLVGKPENGGSAVLTSGGVWYDMDEKLYKMWYQAGFAGQMAYATSEDGINWKLPVLSGGDGSNVFLRNFNSIAGSCVWMDVNAEPAERYKLLFRQSDKVETMEGDGNTHARGRLYVSENGTQWVPAGTTGYMGDRSTFFYNDLLDEWVFSIRYNTNASYGNHTQKFYRTRLYHSGSTWQSAAQWDWVDTTSSNKPIFWQKPDTKDPVDTSSAAMGGSIQNPPMTYNLDAICYESITLGLYQIWYGPENKVLEQTGKTKITEIQAAFSRDGFYFDRPVRGAGNALIPASRTEGTWDYGYLSTTTGGVIVSDDEIRIYYSAISNKYVNSDGQTVNGAYFGGSIGYATLRRDGFASMSGSGTLLTKPLTVTKDVKYLFVNADASQGSLKAEILDANGNVLDGYSTADCIAMTNDSCCTMLTWNGAGDLSFLQGKGFRVRFVSENADLYSFWLSADPNGASGGSIAAGYTGDKDLDPDLTVDSQPTDSTTEDNGGKKRGCRSAIAGSAVMLLPILTGAFLFQKKRSHKKG